MVTNNVKDLALNRGVYAFVLNPQGRIQGDLYAYNLGDALLWIPINLRRKNLATFDPLHHHG